MNWHQPDLYLFLCKLAGLAALLAIAYELVSRRRKPPVILMKAMPLEPASVPDPRQAGKQEAEPFSQLCESTKDLQPKEQASRVREHFGIFGGVRPHRRNEGDAPVYLKNVRPLEGLARDHPLESTKDLPPKEQASHERDHFGNFAGARPVSQHSRTRL